MKCECFWSQWHAVIISNIINFVAVIGFVDTDVVVSEAGGIANLTIQSTALTQEVTVRFSTVDNTAVGEKCK